MRVRFTLCRKIGIVGGICLVTMLLLFMADGSYARANTVSVPLDQVPAALADAAPGDTVLVESGTYSDVTLNLTFNSSLLTTVQAETPGEVKIVGNSTIFIQDSSALKLSGFLFDQTSGSSSIVVDNSSDVDISNNYFFQNGASASGMIVKIMNGSANNRVHHNTFDGSKAMSVVIMSRTIEDIQNTGNEIYNNLFYNIPSVGSVYPGQNNGLEAIQLGQGDSFSIGPWVHEMDLHTKVYDNLFENITGDGSEIISSKTSSNEFYRNTFLNNNSGFTVRLGESNKIMNNYFEGTKSGIRVYGYNHLIKNNYLLGGQYGIMLPTGDNVTGGTPAIAGAYYQVDSVQVEGNVIANPSSQAFRIGSGYTERYSLLPINTAIVSNSVYLANSAKDYMLDSSVTVPYDPLPGFQCNVSVLKAVANQGNIMTSDSAKIAYTYTASPTLPTPESITGVVPFSSKDPLTGASWKTPDTEGWEGSGTVGDPYLIETAEDLDAVRNDLNAHYRLVADIDLSGFGGVGNANETWGWTPIGVNSALPFKGSLDGNGFVIYGLTVNTQLGAAGLFGRLDGAVLRNIGLVDVSIHNYGAGDQTGALVGRMNGNAQVSNSYAVGEVTGRNYTGGLVGRVFDGEVTDSYASVVVTGTGTQHNTGGLIGQVDDGQISSTYANGLVSSNTSSGTGGLIGKLGTGTVVVTDSYWDINTTNQSTSAGGGSGLTSGNMKKQSSYVGWDFSNIWEIEEDVGYPYLQIFD